MASPTLEHLLIFRQKELVRQVKVSMAEMKQIDAALDAIVGISPLHQHRQEVLAHVKEALK